MALVNKQDSNFTGLRYAVEETPGVLPTTPVWIELEPNSYNDFGGSIETKARNPINASRQRKKGVIIDLNAQAGFVQDITPTNVQGLMEAFMFAATREKTNMDSTAVDGTANHYVVASGGAAFAPGDLVFAEDFDTTANNGLKVAAPASTATNVLVTDTGLVTEAGAEGHITKVGYQFPTGLASINATASEFPKLVAANVAATGTLTLGSNPVVDDEVVIGSRTYLFKANPTTVANEVEIGADASGSIDNLIAAINLAAGSGTLYGSATTINPDVTAAVGGGDTMVLTAKVTGVVGNSIATTTDVATSSFASATLTGGAGRALDTLGLIPGEFVYIGGDAGGTMFATPEDNGYCRVRSTSANEIVFDKTQFIMEDDAGAGLTLQIFLGHCLKNETDRALIVTKTLQMERSLGAPDDSLLAQVQAEYIVNCLANELTLNMTTADIAVLDVSFLAGDNETRTGAEGLKTGDRPALVDTDAFNTVSDLSLIKMAVVTDGDSCPTPLFAFLTDLELSINNNITQNKALGVLGSFSSSPGTFEVSATVTAYFQTVDAIRQARANASVTLEQHLAKANRGVSIDLPLLTLANVAANVEQDEPVTLPIESDAATAKLIHPTLDYTALWMFWTYLPTAAE